MSRRVKILMNLGEHGFSFKKVNKNIDAKK